MSLDSKGILKISFDVAQRERGLKIGTRLDKGECEVLQEKVT